MATSQQINSRKPLVPKSLPSPRFLLGTHQGYLPILQLGTSGRQSSKPTSIGASGLVATPKLNQLVGISDSIQRRGAIYYMPRGATKIFKFSVVPKDHYIHLLGTLVILQLGTLQILVISQVPNIDIVLGLFQAIDLQNTLVIHSFPS